MAATEPGIVIANASREFRVRNDIGAWLLTSEAAVFEITPGSYVLPITSYSSRLSRGLVERPG